MACRDQLGRHIAEIDYWARRVAPANVLIGTLLVMIGVTAMFFGISRSNETPGHQMWSAIVGAILGAASGAAVTCWRERRRLQRDLLPRKRRLEALLKELDGQ